MKKFILIGMFAFISHANAALLNSYDFNGNLSDTLNNGVDLVSSGGVLNSGRYSFTANQGLRLLSALPNTDNYGIEIKFQLSDNLSGFNKVIDFQDLTSDIGLYILDGKIDFFTVGPNAGVVSLNNDFTLGLSRSAGTISVFLDNTLLFSVEDNGQAVSASNILNFFEDDIATRQREAFVGSADFIRIHNDSSTFGTSPIPIPAALWLFFSGLIGLIGITKPSKLTVLSA